VAHDISANFTLQSLAHALGGVVRNGEVLAPGPGHSPVDKSLSVKLDPAALDGFVVHSFAHDDPIECRDYVREKCGLPAFGSNGNRKPAEIKRAGPTRLVLDDATIAAALAAIKTAPPQARGKVVKTYDYTDADGTLLYQTSRFEPKDFRQRRPKGNGSWTWNLNGVPRVPYRLPDLIKYKFGTVFVTEGEKDADRLAEYDLCATTVASGKWDGIDIDIFASRDVMILEDNDDAGRKKASDAASLLHGVASTVRIVSLPGLPERGDVSDWLDDGHNADELIEVCFKAPLWHPAQSREKNPPAALPTASKGILRAPEPPREGSLHFIDVTAWHGQPVPDREWCVLSRIPMRNVTLFSGEGAIGKSIVSLQLAVAHVLGRHWLGTMPEKGPVVAIACEDDASELHRRLSLILNHYEATFADLKDLHLLSLAGQDALLAAPDKNGLIKPTQLFDQLSVATCNIRPKLVILDNSADVFGGSENDRAQVRQFIGILRGLAIAADAGVLLTSHPSLTGITSGSGISGSTAWDASVRSRLYMKRVKTEKDEEPDPDLRVIELMKSNYGPVGETITVRWKEGVFVPVAAMGTLDKLAAERAADDLFLKLLDRFQNQGRNLSDKPTANNYAPKMFATDPDGKGRRRELTDAMARLFAAGKIKVEAYGRPSRQVTRLVRDACVMPPVMPRDTFFGRIRHAYPPARRGTTFWHRQQNHESVATRQNAGARRDAVQHPRAASRGSSRN
jgi:RecA-family ATPase